MTTPFLFGYRRGRIVVFWRRIRATWRIAAKVSAAIRNILGAE